MRRLLLAITAVCTLGFGLSACETATPYQPARPGDSNSGGYSDFRVDSSHWRVTFRGNSLTSRETVEKYLLYRAAELTRDQGYDWFDATQRQTDKKSSYFGYSDPFYGYGFGFAYGWGWRPYWRYYGPGGWRGWDPWYGGPFWADTIDVRQIDRFEASAEIVMGKGPAPNGQRVFNAQEVMANLGPTIERPKS
jgi:hypothetical protein